MNETERKRRTLTPHERECARRVKQLWLKKKQKEGLKQQDIAEYMDMSTSGVGQYMNGIIPLNMKVIMKFALYFECSTSEIDPCSTRAELLNDDERKLLAAFRYTDRRGKSTMLDVADMALGLSEPAQQK